MLNFNNEVFIGEFQEDLFPVRWGIVRENDERSGSDLPTITVVITNAVSPYHVSIVERRESFAREHRNFPRNFTLFE